MNDCRRGRRRLACFDESSGYVWKVLHAHIEDEGSRSGQRRPVYGCLLLVGILVTGNKCEDGVECAVGRRYASICRGGYACGNSWHDFERYLCIKQNKSLLCAATEDVWVAALKPYDNIAFACLSYEKGVDVVLLHGVISALFSYIDTLSCVRCILKQQRIG